MSKGFVVVTGATSGIGRACVLALDSLGYEVLGTYLVEDEIADLRERASGSLQLFYMDLTKEDTIREAGAAIAEAVGERGLAGLLNNAGVDIPSPLEFIPLDRLREQLEINVVGQIAMTQVCLSLIRKARGRIVFIGSIDGRAVTPFQGAYGASKHAIEAITDVFRMELRAWGIRVCVVEPGDIATPIWKKSMSRADEMLKEVPQAALDLYGPIMDAARATAKMMEQQASSPDIVVKAVIHALTAKRPRPRYLVGTDAKIRLALEWLPASWVDKLIMGFIKKGGPKAAD